MVALPFSFRDPRNVMIQRLRVLGLGVSSLESSGFTLIDEDRLSMLQIDFTGHTQGSIWLEPALLIDRELTGGYGSEILATHYPRRGNRSLVLCENLVDGLLVAQGLKDCVSMDTYTVATSTAWSRFPKEWSLDAWWLQWTEIRIVGSLTYGQEIQAQARRDLVVLAPIHLGGGWKGDSAWNWMEDWLAGGEYLLLEPAETCEAFIQSSLEGYTPVDIHGAYTGGYLHYAATLLERTEITLDDGCGGMVTQQVERKVLRVIKSDRTMQKVVQSPAPPGTRQEDRIYRLEDGTLISGVPATSASGSWSVESILSYIKGEATIRILGDLLADILSVLKARVWLPNEADYYVLSLAVAVSYVQTTFDAVPLLLATGPMNTGKSELGKAMASVGANGDIISRASAATISRRIDQTRGLTVLDDLEEVARKGGAKGQAQFTELIQVLKLSYKKETATRTITEGTAQVTLNYYGVKLANNTRGTDDILGSRMLRILTAKKPGHVVLPTSSVQTARLRNDLHVWAFANVEAVAKAYAAYPVATDRSEEITASLRVIARLSGVAGYEANLDTHLSPAGQGGAFDPEKEIRTVMEEVIRRGDAFVSPTEVKTEMARNMATANCKMSRYISPEWIGIQLRALGYIARDSKPIRKRKDGKFLRKYPLLITKLPFPPGPSDPTPEREDVDGPFL